MFNTGDDENVVLLLGLALETNKESTFSKETKPSQSRSNLQKTPSISCNGNNREIIYSTADLIDAL